MTNIAIYPDSGSLANLFVHRRIMKWKSELTSGKLRVFDIGCRSSRWPAWLAIFGNQVTACERSKGFRDIQNSYMTEFKTNINFIEEDLLSIPSSKLGNFDVITSIFAIQHNADGRRDAACYSYCADFLKPESTFYIATEFGPQVRIQKGRDDGDMIIYDAQTIKENIVEPICEKKVPESIKFIFFRFDTGMECPEDKAHAVLLELNFK